MTITAVNRRSAQRGWAGAGAIGALVVALTAGAATDAQAAGTLPPPNAQALRASIAGLPNAQLTSAVVLVDGKNGHWSGTSGTGDLVTGRPVAADGRFRIGSISKVFTATVVLQLAAEQRVDLNDAIQQYLPGVLPASYPLITVRQLLNHTSGLPTGGDLGGDDGSAQWFVDHKAEGWTPQQVVAEAGTQPMQFQPGTAQQYNGLNYYLAGLLVEQVTGHSYAQEVNARILRPLGLHDTSLPAADDTRLPDPTAHAYLTVTRPDGSTTQVDVTRQSPWPWAEGGMISSAPDLDRFLTALLRGRLLPPAQQAELYSVPDVPNFQNPNCDLGPTAGHACFSTGLMRFSPSDGVVLWGKTGSRPGYSSGIFATQDAARDLVYSLTPTSRNGASFAAQYGIASAAFNLAGH
ncbi:D-alanyl-D-alanine carboxypeptidase [Kitasatospora sp. MAP12-15]|uniref:serine hydrolase domain-containing protein n=1 Tax=unclassified Kitasatospora TaxID=2633591 RepID=UPI002474487E|nr:serine hydrolase domain-containing protein [Kitasatospora sp. MAP12-44]MDH6108716.1 D-alanyl-D-alanine carboxypeptidase [Kitasatospora sp. MAP12-44]